MPVELYLATSYRPDCEFIDGEVHERNVGTFDHSFVLGILVSIFGSRREVWEVDAFPTLRVRIGPQRFRVPDITVMPSCVQWGRILESAALLFVEVLSPEDSLRDVRERVDDYLNLGTEHVWIVDPGSRKGYVCSRTGFQEPECGVLAVPGTPIRVVLSELFAELDRA